MAQPAPPAAQEQAEPAPASGGASLSDETIYIQDANGRWVPRPLTSDADLPQPTVVPAYIAQLQIDGDVVGDHADLTVRVRVEITQDDGLFDVPLALDQAAIYDSEHEGAGDAAPTLSKPGTTDVHWRFRGEGTHWLTIKCRVPVRSTVGGQQLQLSLPVLPANYITQAVLRVPDGNVVTFDPPQNSMLEKRVLESGVTELHCDIAGPRWELAWRTQADAAPRLARVVTGVRMQADRDARLLRMVALQDCTIEQGKLTEISVQLPGGYLLESVDLVSPTPQSLATVDDADRPGWVRVLLGEGMQGTFELKWQLTRALPTAGAAIVVEGLVIDGARQQVGTIEVESVEGYGARYLADESSLVQRGDVIQRRAGEPPFDFRFEFQRQPFVLTYELTPLAAQTDARSEAFLAINAESTDLFVDVHLNVLSGQVHEIVLDWPNHGTGGWMPNFARAIVAVSSGGAAVDVAYGTVDQDAFAADPDQLRLHLSRPCDGSLQTLLHFTRSSTPESGSLELTVPHPVATVRRAQTVSLASAVNLRTTLTVNDLEPPRVPREGALPAGLPSQFGTEDVRVYSLATHAPAVTVQWEEQRKSITAETTISAELLENVIHVSQDISFNVEYDYVDALLLEPPPEFPGGASAAAFRAGGGSGLHVQLDGQEVEAESRDDYWRVDLIDVRRGRFQLKIEYALPAEPNAESGTISVPVLQSVDAPFNATTLRLLGARELRLADSETGWQVWLTRAGDNAWLTSESKTGIELQIDDTSQNIPQQFSIETAFVHAWFGDPGKVAVYAEYVIDDAPRNIVVSLPAQSTAQFRWDGKSLPAQLREAGNGAQALEDYLVELPVGAAEALSGRLSIRYRTRRESPPGLVSSCAVDFPQFGDKVVVDETYWEVALPPGEQLYASPRGMVPQFSWERETVLWSRRPTSNYRKLRSELVVHEQDDDAAEPRGNVYAYSAIGTVPSGEFGAMKLSLIVLIGAGIALSLGFMYRRLPWTRNLLSVIVVGFCLALAALWELELIQLLLQPAVLGIVLALIAASFDVARRDQRRDRRERLSGERRSTAVPLSPVIAARTAVYHPDPVSDPGRSG